MNTTRTLSMCVVLIAGFVLLSVSVQSVVQAQCNQSAVAFSTKPSNTSYDPPACTPMGRQCNPSFPTCCAGLKCVFHGGSTRVGYMCTLGKVATSSSWELNDRAELIKLLR
jgi:hypothetical protein